MFLTRLLLPFYRSKSLLLIVLLFAGVASLSIGVTKDSQAKEPAWAVTPIEEGFTYIDLIQDIYHLEDPTGVLTLDEIMNKPLSSEWTEDVFLLGFSDSKFWYRTSISNQTDSAMEIVIQFRAPAFRSVEQYITQNKIVLDKKLFGVDNPKIENAVDNRHTITFFTIEPGVQLDLYYRFSSDRHLFFPVTIWTKPAFEKNENWNLALHGAYFGIVVALALYNLFIGLVIRERSYFYYVGFTLCSGVFIAHRTGYGLHMLWPDSLFWHMNGMYFVGGILQIFASLFAIHFLDLKKESPVCTYLLRIVIAVALFYSLASLTGYHHIAGPTSFVLGLIQLPLLLVAGVISWRNGYKYARFFVIPWSLVVFNTVWVILGILRIVPYDTLLSEHGLTVSAVVEIILLSFALAARIQDLKEQQAKERELSIVRETNAIQTERTRIMRDLHDDVGAKLLTLIHRLKGENSEIALSTLQSLRDTIYVVDSTKRVYLEDLIEELSIEIQGRLNLVGIELRWEQKGDFDETQLTPRYSFNLTRIIREAVTNAIKHAHPNHLLVSVDFTQDLLSIAITNDGDISDLGTWEEGKGINNIRCRAEEINTSVHWSTQETSAVNFLDKGSVLTLLIKMPLEEVSS